MPRQGKITFGEMRASGASRIIVHCGEYKCGHSDTMYPPYSPITSGSLTWNSVSFAVSAGIAAPMSGRCLGRRAWVQTPRTHPISAATPALPNQESGDQAQNQVERERLHDSLTIMMTMITAVTAMAAIGSIPASLQYHRRLLSSIAAVPALTTIARIRSVIASSLMTTRGD